jgi:hypothetical protein
MADNLVLGRGKVYFAPYPKGQTTGGTKGYFGNTPEFALAQNVTNLDHYSAESGLKVKDRTVQLQTDASLTFATDNISVPNLMLWFGGNSTGAAPSDAPADVGSLVFIGSASQIYGALWFESDNPVGDNLNYWFPYVALRPNGNYALKGDAWQTLGFIGEALKRDPASERFYAYLPPGGGSDSTAADDTDPTYLTKSDVDQATGAGTPATGGTVTAPTPEVHATPVNVSYTLTGGTLGYLAYCLGSPFFLGDNMALADFTPERVEIKHNGSVVCSVRGLGTDDISVLVRAHLDTMNKLFEIARSADDFGSVNFFAQMVTSAPQIAMDVIALAADEPNYPPSTGRRAQR